MEGVRMDMNLKVQFLERWEKYFPGADLPIIFYYTDQKSRGEKSPPPKGHRCFICELAKVRKGKSLLFDIHSIGCGGGKRYLGFSRDLIPDFEYFLSCGREGVVEGERYKKSPELVREWVKHQTPFEAPEKYIVFKRWDRLDENDEPLVVIFFASGDALSGLFTLANFDTSDPFAVITPFCAGCASIVAYPYRELQSDEPRAVLGMFDVSARYCIPAGNLSFAIPWPKFVRMIENMEESFLTTESWKIVRKRMA